MLVVHNGHRQIALSQWEAIPPAQKQAMEVSFAEGARTPGTFRARYLSCYRPGDFLHRHNDHLDETDGIRSAAYILNLTPSWNALNFLKVPQLHFVSAVAPFVNAPRLSVSGWVRRR